MVSSGGYRVVSAGGTIAATLAALLLANLHAVQLVITTTIPLVRRLHPTTLQGPAFGIATLTTILAVGIAVAPLYKPQPRRILNVVYHTHRRVLLAGLALATIGYFDYTYRLPRTTLLLTISILLVVLPVWFVMIRRRPDGNGTRTLIIGDDADEIERVYTALAEDPVGYVGPVLMQADGGTTTTADQAPIESDASVGAHGRVGGLSRLADVITAYEIDRAAFAFEHTDRGEFFGALGTCHDHGVDAVIRRDRADSVLIADQPGNELVEIDVEPWDWQDRAIKRLFDLTFAISALLVLLPVILVIAAAIKLDDGGAILYEQERTAELGETFPVYKFRSMQPRSASVEPGEEADRVTRVGRLLRKTHLDEIPQLWSILVGDMSVVGPRAVWTDEEYLLEADVAQWRQRWFVKPGLTGLAQINDVSSENPTAKLRYDVDYIRNQSLRYDVAIVVRQLWKVFVDAVTFLRGEDPDADD
ncbi:sugar transferase [Salarchaeum sp. JOR-1]|uniref:sugar transferase n=1 Tax=Salarchaeum sp. JOR-1 TaxID=2599399 RepID=UPI001198A6DA|nr:sugar transferase [Salarchaeum sp. JOR-1]QDX40819.1 sugar transferase [Salarchaeum sp. JOR-1]